MHCSLHLWRHALEQIVHDMEIVLVVAAMHDAGLLQEVLAQARPSDSTSGVEAQLKKFAKARAVVVEALMGGDSEG